jgi:hypothetical protein
MSLTSTVEWRLSLPPGEAIVALSSALERIGGTVTSQDESHIEAETRGSLSNNRPAARWRITAEPLLEGSKVTIAVDARNRHSAVLDELGRQLGQAIVFRGSQLGAWGLSKQKGAEARERKRKRLDGEPHLLQALAGRQLERERDPAYRARREKHQVRVEKNQARLDRLWSSVMLVAKDSVMVKFDGDREIKITRNLFNRKS